LNRKFEFPDGNYLTCEEANPYKPAGNWTVARLGEGEKTLMKKWGFRGLVIVVVLAGGIYLAAYFIRSLSHEEVEDAYIAGTIVPIASEVRGRVVKINFKDNQSVEAGNPLLEIAPDDFSSVFQERKENILRLNAEGSEIKASIEEKKKALQQARANLNAALAEENLADKELERHNNLYKEGLVTTSQFEHAESLLKVAQARKEAAAAALAGTETSIKTLEARSNTQNYRIKEAEIAKSRAQLDLSKTVVSAPISGIIAMKNIDVGKYVQPGQSLFSIVKENTWIVANFKETQIKKMTVGQPVDIKVDAYPGKVFKGHIDSLQPGTGSVFSLLPPENATGNFIKVVQRIPVKIVIDTPFDPDHPLWPGMSVVPDVDVSRSTGSKISSK
jgi:membrane fusion protein, multidrug efflux system